MVKILRVPISQECGRFAETAFDDLQRKIIFVAVEYRMIVW